LCVRLLCSLPLLLICTVVSQVAVLPSYNSIATVSLQIVRQIAVLPSFTGNLHCYKSGRCAPFLQQWGHSQLTLLTACSNFILVYPNLFEFILNLFEFCRIFEWLCIRSLCSLSSLLICTVVSQVAVLPSYNSKTTVSLQIVCQLALLTTCSNFILICPNLFEFILNLFEFCRVFKWKERVWECLGKI